MKRVKFREKEMKRFGDGISKKVLKEVFPKKLNRSLAFEHIYSHLKQMILSGELRKGQRLLALEFTLIFDVNHGTVSQAFSQLRKDGLVISKGRRSFVA